MVVEIEEGEDGGASTSERMLVEGVGRFGRLSLLGIIGLHSSNEAAVD